jgi:hypothetical protein
VNCDEFVHELYRQAIVELMAAKQLSHPEEFQQMLAEYGDPEQANQVKNLVEPSAIESEGPGVGSLLAIEALELIGQHSLTERAAERGEMKSEFEGEVKTWNLYPEEWATSLDATERELYDHGWYSSAVIRSFTPGSFMNSRYFTLVSRVKSGKLEMLGKAPDVSPRPGMRH